MAMINYTNKVALNTNSGIADINKCNAIDMNEIKNAFNNQVAQGWYNIGVTTLLALTYVSFNSTTKIGVIASNLDLTPYLSVGMKFKFTQNSAVKYGIITAISSTQITLFMGNNFTLNNSGISNPFYSMVETPYGFPQSIYSLVDNIVVPTNEFLDGKRVYAYRYSFSQALTKDTEVIFDLPFASDIDYAWVDFSNCYFDNKNNTATPNIWCMGTIAGYGFRIGIFELNKLSIKPDDNWNNTWTYHIVVKFTKK